MWDVVWCAVPDVVRCEILSCGLWDVECIMHCHCISHHITLRPPHFTLHHSTSSQLALFQTTPHSTSHHSSPPRTFHITPAPLVAAHYSTLQYHISNRTTSATLCITPLTSRIGPHFTLLTYHITPHSMYSTPQQFPITPYIGHIIYASLYHISHHILHNIAPLFTCSPSCVIPPHLTVITPNAMFHITFHITDQYTTTTTRYCAVSSPHYLNPHRTTFHIPCHSTRTNPHYTTTFHNPILVWETLNYMWSVLLCSFIHIQLFVPHVEPNTKMVVKKCNFIHKVP